MASVLQNIPKSYLYGQYADDANLKASRDAYNGEAQGLFSWLQNTVIADYRQDPISGNLLDFVAAGLYNMQRRVMVSVTPHDVTGAIGDVPFGNGMFAGGVYDQTTNPAIILTDDQFRRAIMWNMYAADGWVFSTPWLRRRIARFMFAANGIGEAVVEDQQLVSINWPSTRTADIFITAPASSSTTSAVLQIGLDNGYLRSPIGYTFNVTLLNYQASATDFGGDIL